MRMLNFKNGMPARAKKLLISWLSIGTMTILLTGCGEELFSCPPIVKYSVAFQRQAADQLGTLPKGSPVRVMTTHYGQLRDACRSLDGARGSDNR